MTRDITTRAVTTATATSAAWAAARLTGRAKRARTVALAALVGAQLGQTVAIGGRSPAVLASSVGSAAVLAGIVQTPGLSGFFGCTPLGPVGWTIAGTATAATALLPPVLSRLGSLLAEQPAAPSAVHVEVAKPSAEPVLAPPPARNRAVVEELLIEVLAAGLIYLFELLVVRLIRQVLPAR